MTSIEQVSSLNENFGLPGVLQFELAPEAGAELVRAQIILPGAVATVYLHGAHITHWQPAEQAPVLFMSERSDFEPMKPIRGGIPICFPWFGPRGGGLAGPSHGFARLLPWQVSFAALMPSGTHAQEDVVHLVLTLEPGEFTRSLGYDRFRFACEFVIGRTLTMRLSVVNLGDKPMVFQEALHSYFHVGDVRHSPITGLEGAKYIDKRDEMREKKSPDGPLQLTATTDRIFPANAAATTIHDESLGRKISIDKTNSATTIVWNPWEEVAKTMSDLDPASWPEFLCVEAANAGADAITLGPQEAHTMQLTISIL